MFNSINQFSVSNNFLFNSLAKSKITKTHLFFALAIIAAVSLIVYRVFKKKLNDEDRHALKLLSCWNNDRDWCDLQKKYLGGKKDISNGIKRMELLILSNQHSQMSQNQSITKILTNAKSWHCYLFHTGLEKFNKKCSSSFDVKDWLNQRAQSNDLIPPIKSDYEENGCGLVKNYGDKNLRALYVLSQPPHNYNDLLTQSRQHYEKVKARLKMEFNVLLISNRFKKATEVNKSWSIKAIVAYFKKPQYLSKEEETAKKTIAAFAKIPKPVLNLICDFATDPIVYH